VVEALTFAVMATIKVGEPLDRDVVIFIAMTYCGPSADIERDDLVKALDAPLGMLLLGEVRRG
jgi:hypothetical protein